MNAQSLRLAGATTLILAAIAAAPGAYAATLALSTNGDTTVNVGTGVTGTVYSNTATDNNDTVTATGNESGNASSNTSSASSNSAQSNTNGNANVGLNATVRATVGSASTTSGNASGMTGTTTSSSSNENVLTISRSDVTTNDAINVDPISVTTATDLETYVRAMVKNDENVTKVETSDTDVNVWYKEHGKFLGFIPVTVSTRAAVNVDGSVTIDHPWYSFLTTTEDKAQIESDVSATAGTIARAEGSAKFSSNMKARLVNALRSVMKTHYEASATASSSATSNVDVNY